MWFAQLPMLLGFSCLVAICVLRLASLLRPCCSVVFSLCDGHTLVKCVSGAAPYEMQQLPEWHFKGKPSACGRWWPHCCILLRSY